MSERAVDIPTPDGGAGGYLYHPDVEPRYPGVIYLTDIGGIREANRGMAQRLSEQGYTVLMPNIFYRSGRPPIFETPFRAGDERSMKRMGELRAALTPEAMDRDASAYVDYLSAVPAAGPGAFGVVGFCFSGAFAMRVAASRPERIASVASFHGGGLYTDKPESPHLLLPRIQARLYFGHAADDRGMPREAIAKFEEALAAWGGRYESEYYEGAYHGWTVPDTPVYNEPKAERAFQKLTALLAGTLR